LGRGGRQFESGHPDKSLVAIQDFFVFMYIVYIIYSCSLKKFYTGFSADMEQRMAFHNNSMNHFTKKGVAWNIIATFEVVNKGDAMLLEKQIKKNGAKR
jgi:putative endonuclease